MAFMTPHYDHMSMWRVETTNGTELVPCDVANDPDNLSDYLEGKQQEDEEPEKVTGWFARLSADGYMDCTDWSGPFDTEDEAREYIRDFYDVDPDTGDELSDE